MGEIDEDFHIAWWPVDQREVKQLHPDAEQAVIVYDYKSNEAYIQVLLKGKVDENERKLKYEFTADELSLLNDEAKNLRWYRNSRDEVEIDD